MTTQPTNHRAEAERYVSQTDPDVDDIVGLGILHGILALHDLLAGLADEEQHQSEKFESTPLDGRAFTQQREATPDEMAEYHAAWADAHTPAHDDDNPDTLVEDDTVEQPRFGLDHIPDNAAGYEPSEEPADRRIRDAEPADRVRLSGFAAIHRHDDFGPPWGAA